MVFWLDMTEFYLHRRYEVQRQQPEKLQSSRLRAHRKEVSSQSVIFLKYFSVLKAIGKMRFMENRCAQMSVRTKLAEPLRYSPIFNCLDRLSTHRPSKNSGGAVPLPFEIYVAPPAAFRLGRCLPRPTRAVPQHFTGKLNIAERSVRNSPRIFPSSGHFHPQIDLVEERAVPRSCNTGPHDATKLFPTSSSRTRRHSKRQQTAKPPESYDQRTHSCHAEIRDRHRRTLTPSP
jgi:hypothetical protein